MFYEGNNPIGESGLINLSKAGWMGLFQIDLNFSLKEGMGMGWLLKGRLGYLRIISISIYKSL